MSKHQEGRSPFVYFALTIGYSWALWLPAIFLGLDDYGLSAYTPLALLGAVAPMAAAVTLISRKHDWKEAWQFIRQAFDIKTKPVYFLLALSIPVIIHAVAHYLAIIFNLDVADTLLGDSSPLLLIPYFFFILLLGGGQEEFGWRGYAQDPLQERFGVIKASLLIGFVWGVWHLPLWAFPEAQGAYSFPAFVLMTVGVSLVYSLLYNASGQKLIIPWLYHAMWNTVPPLFPFLHEIDGKPQTAYWVFSGVNVLAGLIAAVLMEKMRLRKGQNVS